MKVFTKILGAVLLLGCLAYISFVFGKYVLSSTLLKSIPKSERIISTDNPTPTSASVPASSSDGQTFSPQVEMRVMPSTRSTRENSADTDNNDDSSTNSSDSADTDNTRKKPKKFDEGELSSSRRKRSQRDKKAKEADEAKKAATETEAAAKTPKKKPSTSSSAPIRRLNQVDKKEETSPVPKAEKSTSTPSDKGNAPSISPVPKPE